MTASTPTHDAQVHDVMTYTSYDFIDISNLVICQMHDIIFQLFYFFNNRYNIILTYDICYMMIVLYHKRYKLN